jgi:hypothetical protein
MIGAFLTRVLYGGDYHMNEMLTSMVDEGKSAVYITREVMAFYQIWDNNHRIPLWTTLIDDDGIEESLHASGRNLAMANPASSAVAVAEHARRLKVDKLNIIRAEWPSFVSDLTDVQIDELANHVRNGEKGVFRPLLSVPESPKVIEELRRLDSHKKDPRRDLDFIQFDGSGYSLTDSAPQRAVWEQDKPLPVIPKKKDVGVQTFTRDGSRWI